MKKAACNPIVIVEWEDAISEINSDVSKLVKAPPFLVKTYGVLVKKGKYHIIKMHDGGGNECDDLIRVPSGLVRRIAYLKEGK